MLIRITSPRVAPASHQTTLDFTTMRRTLPRLLRCNSSPRLPWILSPRELPLCRTRIASSAVPRRSSTLTRPARAEESTIYALSTPPGKSAIAIVRISGPRCLPIYHQLTRSSKPPLPRTAHLHPIHSPTHVLDPGALCLYFPGPHSHTGTDLLEIHLHGAPAIIRSVLGTLSTLAIPATAGEFTKRAFYNNRLSLPEVEILGDTLSAVTEQQRRRAVKNTKQLTKAYREWRESLLSARGELEAIIDFSEDQAFESSPGELLHNVSGMVTGLKQKLNIYVSNAMRGELLRNGIQLAIVGAPNVGKSSLLNRILAREAAIVSDEAGTTRDVLDAQVDVGGYLCLLADTAGLRKGAGKVEAEGIRRARQRAEGADVVVVVIDASRWAEQVGEVGEIILGKEEVCVVVNKIDLLSAGDWPTVKNRVAEATGLSPSQVLGITAKLEDDSGVSELLQHLASRFEKMTEADGGLGMEESVAATERQRVLVQECLSFLEGYEEIVGTGGEEVDFVLAAEELRGAATALGKILGVEGGDVEDVLGVVFERFCVGK